MSYITLDDLSNDLGIYEYQIRTTYGDTVFDTGSTLTGDASGETMVVIRAEESGNYFVNDISGIPTLGEELTDTDDNTVTLINSDMNALQKFINRAQDIIEGYTRNKILNTGTQRTDSFVTRQGKASFLLRRHPIISVDTITLNNNVFTGVLNTSYYVNNANGIVSFTNTAILSDAPYKPNLYITYTHGIATATISDVPPALVQVLVMLVTYMFDRWIQVITAPGATSINPAGFAMTFKQGELLTEDVKNILSTYAKWLL